MKKAIFFLLVLTLARVGTAFAGTNNDATIQDFFLGNSSTGGSNLNQVLALLVGPQGVPGVAGVAGADGFVGMNGLDGADGLPGAPGPVGPQGPAGVAGPAGASISVVPFSGAAGNCVAGGTKFIAEDGSTSFACNGVGTTGATGPAGANGTNGTNGLDGTNGTNGLDGTNGTNGVDGTNGTGSNGTGFGAGTLPIGTCDDAVNLNFTHQFNGREFLLTGLTIANLNGNCNSQTLHVFLNIRATGDLNMTGHYVAGDVIDCEFLIHDLVAGDGNARKLKDIGDVNDANLLLGSCQNKGASGAQDPVAIAFNQIGARDLDTTFGFQIAS
jgi:hypothetical protein